MTTQLRAKGVTTFLPLIAQRHRWSDRNKTIQCALFAGYTFARLDVSAAKRLAVLETPGVVGFVGTADGALPIPDKEIEDIQRLIAQNVACALYPFVRVGQCVRIRGGCLDGVEGILLEKKADQTLIVSIELIQRSMAVCIDGYDVEML